MRKLVVAALFTVGASAGGDARADASLQLKPVTRTPSAASASFGRSQCQEPDVPRRAAAPAPATPRATATSRRALATTAPPR